MRKKYKINNILCSSGSKTSSPAPIPKPSKPKPGAKSSAVQARITADACKPANENSVGRPREVGGKPRSISARERVCRRRWGLELEFVEARGRNDLGFDDMRPGGRNYDTL